MDSVDSGKVYAALAKRDFVIHDMEGCQMLWVKKDKGRIRERVIIRAGIDRIPLSVLKVNVEGTSIERDWVGFLEDCR